MQLNCIQSFSGCSARKLLERGRGGDLGEWSGRFQRGFRERLGRFQRGVQRERVRRGFREVSGRGTEREFGEGSGSGQG